LSHARRAPKVKVTHERAMLAGHSTYRCRDAGAERKLSLAERMQAYVRRATVDCALSAGWVCIATLATVDPVRWRTICYALSDTFDLKLKTLEAMTLQSVHRARSSVGA